MNVFQETYAEILGNFHDFLKSGFLRLNLGVFLLAAHAILKANWLRNFYKITLYEVEFTDIFES